MSIERRLLGSTPPEAVGSPPPQNISFEIEDVVKGLQDALSKVSRNHPPHLRTEEHVIASRKLDEAVNKLLKFLKNLPVVACIPVFEITGQDLKTHQLRKILDDEYALFDGPAQLRASKIYPINYLGKHNVPHESYGLDVLPGFEHKQQIYLGYALDDIHDMNGYAVSLHHFLTLETDKMISLGAVKVEKLECPDEYYVKWPPPNASAS